MIDYNSSKSILVIASRRPTSVPNFSWIGVRVCKLQWFFQVREKTKKKKKNEEIAWKFAHSYISETLYAIFFKFGE